VPAQKKTLPGPKKKTLKVEEKHCGEGRKGPVRTFLSRVKKKGKCKDLSLKKGEKKEKRRLMRAVSRTIRRGRRNHGKLQ